ncbi:hypothetical protein Q8F55_003378 [Vanrija albida]|uniref:Uncharacterized protein n=1 Tax=Vanrija albida TaxID=181172 RepID=A0ABR3Q3R0_9TREE
MNKGKKRCIEPSPEPRPTLTTHIRRYPHLYNGHVTHGMLIALRELMAVDRGAQAPGPIPTPAAASIALEIAVARAVALGYRAYRASVAAERGKVPGATLSATEFAEVLEVTVRLAVERYEDTPALSEEGEGSAAARPLPLPAAAPTIGVEIPVTLPLGVGRDDDERPSSGDGVGVLSPLPAVAPTLDVKIPDTALDSLTDLMLRCGATGRTPERPSFADPYPVYCSCYHDRA